MRESSFGEFIYHLNRIGVAKGRWQPAAGTKSAHP
jgi:hypothetical protein